MPHIYIANATPRNHHLHWRLPEKNRMFDRSIGAGQQARLELETTDEVNALLAQVGQYGAVSLESIGRNPDFSGLIFSTRDKPIDIDAIRQGFDLTDEHAVERALEARKLGAMAADLRQGELAQQAGVTMAGSEVTVQEESRGPHDMADKMTQTVEVVREGRAGLKGNEGKRAAARRA